jgi:hypothetical protein
MEVVDLYDAVLPEQPVGDRVGVQPGRCRLQQDAPRVPQ